MFKIVTGLKCNRFKDIVTFPYLEPRRLELEMVKNLLKLVLSLNSVEKRGRSRSAARGCFSVVLVLALSCEAGRGSSGHVFGRSWML